MIWKDWEEYLQDSEQTKELYNKVQDIKTIEVPEEYLDLWKKISFLVQLNKAKQHQLSEQQTRECFLELIRRPYFLTTIAEAFDVKNIVEVGTAEGLQFFSFAEYIKQKGSGHVWSCDIRDIRNRKYCEKYNDVTTFCLSNAKDLASQITEKIDLFYIDAMHDRNAVLADVEKIRQVQSENPIWIFDDFDVRFGCYHDIQELCKKSGSFKIYNVGSTASGNPNHQVVIYGQL